MLLKLEIGPGGVENAKVLKVLRLFKFAES